MTRINLEDEGGPRGSVEVEWRSSLKEDLSEFYGCEVCWTCHFFNIQDNKCGILFDGYTNNNKLNGTAYAYRERIENPGWFRCAFWKDND